MGYFVIRRAARGWSSFLVKSVSWEMPTGTPSPRFQSPMSNGIEGVFEDIFLCMSTRAFFWATYLRWPSRLEGRQKGQCFCHVASRTSPVAPLGEGDQSRPHDLPHKNEKPCGLHREDEGPESAKRTAIEVVIFFPRWGVLDLGSSHVGPTKMINRFLVILMKGLTISPCGSECSEHIVGIADLFISAYFLEENIIACVEIN